MWYPSKSEANKGFTLMEIVVATAIFAGTLTLMLTLFNYTLKLNRRVEAMRQVSQATRNFTEFLVREIRNGTIDYSGSIDAVNCPDQTSPASQYHATTNKTLALTNRGGDRECFYLVQSGGNAAYGNLMVTRQTITGVTVSEQVNPPGVNIDWASFRIFVRPTTDPAIQIAGKYPGIQPFATLVMNLSVQLSPQETIASIPYQTTVSTDVYDPSQVPHK